MKPSAYPVLRLEHEADPDGAWMPMAVRMKLDLVGLKIGLADWQALDARDRDTLLGADVETDEAVGRFTAFLERSLADAGRPAASHLSDEKLSDCDYWRSPGPVPARVAAGLAAVGHADLWSRLDRFGRFVLFSLCRKDGDLRLAGAIEELARRAGEKSRRMEGD
jgi:hypothetical protein